MASEHLSLRDQLLNWLLMPLLLLLIFAAGVSYLASIKFANLPYDQALLETAHTLAASLRAGGYSRELELPALANRMVLGDPEDRMYFKISLADGQVLAGDPRLRLPGSLRLSAAPQFGDAEVGGEKVRLATLLVFPEGEDPRPYFVVQVAETLNRRKVLTREILGTMVVPQLLLILFAGVAVWYGLRQGFAPLVRMQQTLAQRSPHDLSPVEIKPDLPAEIVPLIAAFNDILGRMREVLDSHRRFVGDAAHQLRTPFAGLKTQAELALRLEDRAELTRALCQILASAERGSTLVNQLLALARHEPGANASLQFEPVDLNRVVQEAALRYVEAALEKDIDLGFEAAERPVHVWGEAVSLQEMVGNLLDNAIRYTPRGGKVTARVWYQSGYAWMAVEDNGPGIPAADRRRVFERFYRVLGSTQPGSGLGLAIVEEIVRLHNGEVSVDEPPAGTGAVFTLRFPAHWTPYSPRAVASPGV